MWPQVFFPRASCHLVPLSAFIAAMWHYLLLIQQRFHCTRVCIATLMCKPRWIPCPTLETTTLHLYISESHPSLVLQSIYSTVYVCLIAGFGVPQVGRFIGWLNWREKCLNTETAPKRWVSEQPWISHKVIQSPEGTWKINSCTPAVPSTCFHHNLILCL